MVITRMVTTLIAMIVSTALFAGETGCKGNYAAVFHPEGMKVVKGWDGNSAPQVFKCYAEVALSGDPRAGRKSARPNEGEPTLDSSHK